MVPQPRVQTGPVRRGGALNAFGLSTLVSNAVRMLPLFYSDTATIEKPQDFRELFEAHTVGLSNQSRLFVFRQKLTGREAERWWNDTTITTFKTLKVRFHNPFLSRMTDEMRYQLFRRGLSNKRMFATLDASPVANIHEAYEWLMFKDMYRPVEEDDDFSNDESTKKKETEPTMLASVDALAQQLQLFMQQQQQ
ncbi:hypothetical protein PC110_g8084 [Phytophthora cactorum]|nr:hypothetical protein PC110_g8084 [Phytophthora cactorum]